MAVILELAFFIVAFAISIIAVRLVAGQNRAMGITGKDINKLDKRELSEGTGIALLAPLWMAIAMFNIFVAENTGFVAFGLAVSVLCFIGFLDDRKPKFRCATISWTSRAAIVAFVCMMFAMFYAPSMLWIVPFAVFVAAIASLENTFAGLNGWEVGSGFIIACFVTALLSGTGPMPLGFALVGAIAGLLIFNAYPARVFPGDSGTLLIGGSIACLVILNQNMWLMLLTLLFFLPHAIDFFALKMLTNRHDMSQSKSLPYSLGRDNRLRIPSENGRARYDFAKMLLRIFGPMPEWLLVLVIWLIVACNCIFWTLVFSGFDLV